MLGALNFQPVEESQAQHVSWLQTSKGAELPSELEYIGEHCFQESALEFKSPPALRRLRVMPFIDAKA